MPSPAPPYDFILVTWEGGGHVTPLFWAGQRLAARGHRVLAVSDQASAAEAAAFGLDFRAWRTAPNRPDKDPAHDPLRDWEAATPADAVDILCERLMVGPALAYARDLGETLAESPGVTVVAQELLLGAMMATERAGTPLALMTANTWPYPTLPGVPPFGPGLAPAATADERAMHGLIATASGAFYDGHLPALNAARGALGLKPLSRLFDQLDAADLILLGTSRAFDFAPPRLPPRFRYAGPQVRVPHWAAEWRSPWPEGDPRPLVLVSFSTLYQRQEAVLARVIAALGRLPVRGLVTLGPAIRIDAFPDPPGNVAVVESASHDAIMPRAAAFVTHGGHGGVIRPLLNGVPLLVMPMGRDQPENAARVEARGAGLRLDPGADEATIAAALDRLLAESAFAVCARALGAAIRHSETEDGDVVVRELEAFAARRLAERDRNPRPSTGSG